MDETRAIADALTLLGVRNLVIAIQDVSFPSAGIDLARGTPYSEGARRFLEFTARVGFTGVQLGPQGLQTAGSASPYEATLFSRNPLNLDPQRLRDDGLISDATLERIAAARPTESATHADHGFAAATSERLVDEVFASLAERPELQQRLDTFAREHRAWLEPDALYEALWAEHGDGYWRRWSGPHAELDRRLFDPPAELRGAAAERKAWLREHRAGPLRRYALAQLLVHEQHRGFRDSVRATGLRAYGDFQIGLSARDEWAHQALQLRGYRMGAPPSRTNPDGQPWNYPVLDPAQYGERETPGPAAALLRARVAKMLDEVDGLRLDHPHGLVCAWVYRDDLPDPLRAVQSGARLRSSPDLPDHPALAPFAIPRPEQLDLSQPRHADGRVRALQPEQVDRYAVLVDVILDEVLRRGGRREDVVCEVLSTLPHPLRRVLERHGLGRFRVLQKANLRDPADVYRSENAAPEDWIMLGNHDTPTIWRVLERWRATERWPEQAAYLARKLEPDPSRRDAFAQALMSDGGAMAQAMLADAFASPAASVQIFFADLFGLTEDFNVPGTVRPENWRLRVPPGYEQSYFGARAAKRALHLPRALALALRSRGADFVSANRGVIDALDRT